MTDKSLFLIYKELLQFNKKKIQPTQNMQRRWKGSSQKKTYKWITNKWKDNQPHRECKWNKDIADMALKLFYCGKIHIT